jgi:tetratricopeptide (TPR) repeat protein
LVIYRRLADTETDPARAEAARKKAAEIQDALVKRIMPDFNQGQKLYSQKKYGEAFKIWVKVLEIYPEAKETSAKVAELTPMLEAEAKRLYEEGLVYQGLGNLETAKARWRDVLTTMPLPENDYYRRAAEKLGQGATPGKTP